MQPLGGSSQRFFSLAKRKPDLPLSQFRMVVEAAAGDPGDPHIAHESHGKLRIVPGIEGLKICEDIVGALGERTLKSRLAQGSVQKIPPAGIIPL